MERISVFISHRKCADWCGYLKVCECGHWITFVEKRVEASAFTDPGHAFNAAKPALGVAIVDYRIEFLPDHRTAESSREVS